MALVDTDVNNTDTVSVGKGVEGGYFFIAPVGATLPDSPDSVPDVSGDNAWMNVGFISSDGVTFSDSQESENYQDMNGDTIATGGATVEKTAAMTLVSVQPSALQLLYGRDNVTDANGVLTVEDKGASEDTWSMAFYFILKNNRRWIRVCEKATPGELGDMTVNFEELTGREITMSIMKGDSGYYWKDYYDSLDTEPEGQNNIVGLAEVGTATVGEEE